MRLIESLLAVLLAGVFLSATGFFLTFGALLAFKVAGLY